MSIKDEIKTFSEYNQRYWNDGIGITEYHKEFLQKHGDINYLYRKQVLPIEAELIKFIANNSKDIDVIFAIYHYLLYSGYLSYNGVFTFGKLHNYILSASGMSVNAGKGVCLDISSHFVDLLRTLYPEQTFLLVGTNSDAAMAKPICSKRIRYNVDPVEATLGNNYKFLSDHVENWIFKEDGLYFFDPTNFLIFKHDPEMKSVVNAPPLDVRINVFDGEFCLKKDHLKNLFDFFEKHNAILNSSKRYLLPPCYLNELLEHGIDLCLSKKSVLDEYKGFMAEPYEKVYRIMK